MDSVLENLRNDDVQSFEESYSLLFNIDQSSLVDFPSIFYSNPNPIAYASFYGAKKCFTFLFKNGIEIQNVDDESRSAIHFACASGNYGMVYMLIEEFDQLHYVDALGRIPLHYSSEYNHIKISKLLIEMHASKHDSDLAISGLVNKKDILGVTPFHLSVEKNNEELIDYFISKEANLNLADSDGCASIHIAAKVGSIKLISKLMQNGAKIAKKSKNGRTIFHFAVFCKMPFIFKELLSLCEYLDININTPDRLGRIPLHYACEQGVISVVHELLKLHSDVSKRDVDMMMPIHFAAINGNPSIIQLLINYGSSVYVKDCSLRTPLHMACESGSYDTVRFLCNKFKKLVKEETKYGSTPLHSVAGNENIFENEQLIRFLVSKGLDINKKNKFGQTPLHCAAQHGLCKTVCAFIESGANVNLTDNSFYNPLDIAVNLNEDKVKEILIENGAQMSPKKSTLSSRLSSVSQSPCSSPKISRVSNDISIEHIDLELDSFL